MVSEGAWECREREEGEGETREEPAREPGSTLERQMEFVELLGLAVSGERVESPGRETGWRSGSSRSSPRR